MQTSDDKMSATHQYSDGQRMMIEDYRVYYGAGGEEIDSPHLKHRACRQVTRLARALE